MQSAEQQTKVWVTLHYPDFFWGEKNQTLKDRLEIIVVIQVWSDKSLSQGGGNGEISSMAS